MDNVMVLSIPNFSVGWSPNWKLVRLLFFVVLITALMVSLAACSTTWLVDLENYLPVALTAISGVSSILTSAGALGPNLPAEIAAVGTAVSQGLLLLCGTPVGNQCDPKSLVGQLSAGDLSVTGAVQNALAQLQGNLAQWLSLIHIKNMVIQQAIAGAITLVQTILAAIAVRIKPVTAAIAKGDKKAARAAIEKSPAMPITVAQFKAQFNQIVSAGGFSQYAVH